MPSLRYLQKRLNRQNYVDLMFSIQILYREVKLPESTLKIIEDELKTFYETHPQSTRTPRVMCAVLCYHFGRKDRIITMMNICGVFDVAISWFRKIHLNYLEELEVTLGSNQQGLSYIREWQPVSSLTKNNVFSRTSLSRGWD